MLFRLVLLAVLHQSVTSYRHFQQKIPNGAHVPFPCKPGESWEGVGHFIDGGDGERNQFGVDFQAAHHTWTVDLCKKDSDGDGRTNGQELGDPDCVWKENSAPNTTEGLSHPGICDPWDSPTCLKKPVYHTEYKTQETWLRDSCKSDVLDCPVLKESDVRNFSIRIHPTPVPASMTTHMCQIFDMNSLGLPPGQDFHIVAATPVIDNKHLVRHMIISGCESDKEPTPTPNECDMLTIRTCRQFLHLWTLGVNNECHHPKTGFRIGHNSYSTFALQLHWSNPTQRADLIDSSGFLVYYTSKLRPNDAGILTVGSDYFYLPPRQPELKVHNTCSSRCTQDSMLGPLSVTATMNHMHFTGKNMIIEIKRNNSHLTYLANETNYSYNRPRLRKLATPFLLLPGDEILTTCEYSTIAENRTIFSGENATDEMCYGFIYYFPKQSNTKPFCVNKLNTSACEPETMGGCSNITIFETFLNTTSVYHEVSSHCNKFTPCRKECTDTIVKYMKSEKCMQGTVWEVIQATLARSNTDGQDFLSRLASCKVEVHLALQPTPSTSTQSPHCNKTSESSAQKTSATTSLVFLSGCVLAAQVWS